MKTVSCNFCGSNSATHQYYLQDWLTHTEGQFSLVRCNTCGLYYLNPQPEWFELEKVYPNEYPSYHKTYSGFSFRQYIRDAVWRRRRRAVLMRKSSGRILDVGCATGEFLAEMSRNPDWDCYGVEPIKYAAQMARVNSKGNIFEGVLIDACYSDNFFDVITLWDVLEHTDNPVDILKESFRILRPDGLLIIRVPAPTSMIASRFGKYWIGWDAPRHLYSFPNKTLVDKLQEMGYMVVDNKSMGSEHFAFFASLSAYFRSNKKHKMGALMNRIAYSTFYRILLFPFFFLLGILRLNSSQVLFAVKK